MTLGRCPLSVFCSRGTPPREPTLSLSPEPQGQNLALTGLDVPYPLDRGGGAASGHRAGIHVEKTLLPHQGCGGCRTHVLPLSLQMVSGFGCQVSGFGFLFRFSVFDFWLSGFRFRVSGFGFRVSGLRFRVSGFGFGFQVSVSACLRVIARRILATCPRVKTYLIQIRSNQTNLI